MKKLLLIPTILIMSPPNYAMAVVALTCTTTTCGSTVNESAPTSSYGASYTNKCYKNSSTGNILQITEHTACMTGYELTSTSYTSTTCDMTYYYDMCTKACDGTCSNCTSGSWTAGNTGYQQRTKKTCNTSTCVCSSSTEYRCASGYYGSSSNGTSGCTRCPSSGGVYGTSAAGSTAITSCYLPSGTTVSFSDSTGSGTAKYTSNCYYTN